MSADTAADQRWAIARSLPDAAIGDGMPRRLSRILLWIRPSLEFHSKGVALVVSEDSTPRLIDRRHERSIAAGRKQTKMVQRLATACAVILTVSLLSGCGLQRHVPNVIKVIAKTPIENAGPEIKAAIAQLKGDADWSEINQTAARDLTGAGLDFACVIPIDGEAEDALRTMVSSELFHRQEMSANAGLTEISAEYERASQPQESLSTTQFVVVGVYALETYCNLDQALEGF